MIRSLLRGSNGLASRVRSTTQFLQQQQQQQQQRRYQHTEEDKQPLRIPDHFVTEKDKFWLRMTGVLRCPASEIPPSLPHTLISTAYSRVKLTVWGGWAVIVTFLSFYSYRVMVDEQKKIRKKRIEESTFPN